MPTLSERFQELAEDSPFSASPEGIWEDGRRRARARRIGTSIVVAATLALLSGIGSLSIHRSSSAGYADQPAATPVLPTVVHSPSRWLSGTGDTPPGRLSLLIPAKRGTWTGYRWGAVGVSATTGVYHFIDIPGCVAMVGLSPDGRRVACWTGVGPTHHAVIDGLAIYDTVTGHVDRFTPGSGTLALNSLAWSGSSAVTLRVSSTSYLWTLRDGAPRPISTHLTHTAGTAGAFGLYASGRHSYYYLGPSRGHQVERIRVEQPKRSLTATPVAVSPSGSRIAIAHLTDTSSELLVGDVAARGRPTRMTAVDTSLQWPTIVGWADDRHVMVVNQVSPIGIPGDGSTDDRYVLDRVDVRTGQVIQVSDVGSLGDGWISFASSMLGAPTRDLPAPPRPLDPRLEAGLVIGVLLLGGVALVVWRRRVRF
jgi:hypothetical protein